MSTVKELKEHLESFNDDDIIAYDIWQIENVKHYCDNMGIEISADQCENVIYNMEQGKDANDGITWDILGFYVQEEKRNET